MIRDARGSLRIPSVWTWPTPSPPKRATCAKTLGVSTLSHGRVLLQGALAGHAPLGLGHMCLAVPEAHAIGQALAAAARSAWGRLARAAGRQRQAAAATGLCGRGNAAARELGGELR